MAAEQERLQLRRDKELLDKEVADMQTDIKQVMAELRREQDAVKAQRLEQQYKDLVAARGRLYDQRQELQRQLAGGAGAAGGSSAGAGATPPFYSNVTLILPSGDPNDPVDIRVYDKTTRANVQRALDRGDCDRVKHPVTRKWVDFDLLELHDGIVLTADSQNSTLRNRVTTLEGFSNTLIEAFEQDATEAVYQHLRQRNHQSVEVLMLSKLTSKDGTQREIDGAVVADGCAAIVEAKTTLDDQAVQQLSSCLEFIRNKELVGVGSKLKGKELMGFLAGKIITGDPGKAKKLVKECRDRGYGILVTSGKSVSLGNSRTPRINVVTCTLSKPRCASLGSTRLRFLS